MELLVGIALVIAGMALFAAGSLGWLGRSYDSRLRLIGFAAYLLIVAGTVLVVVAASG
jgi:hypothetical protein